MAKRTPLADWLYRFRLHLYLTRAEFAHLAWVSPRSVQQWEDGTQVLLAPTRTRLGLLAKQHGFEVPPEVSTRDE